MFVYVALLRGINVSGQKLIKMEHLREIFESMRFRHVRTYIQSGNVLFESDELDAVLLKNKIEDMLRSALGYDVPVILRTKQELEDVVNSNPFQENDLASEGKLYVTFLSEKPTAAAVEHMMTFNSEVDEFQIVGREVYILCRQQYGKSLYSNNFMEKKLKLTATSRNWETTKKLVQLSHQ